MGPFLKVGTCSHEAPLTVSCGNLFLGSTVSEMGESEKCLHPREPLSGNPYSQNRRVEKDSPMCPSHFPGVCLMRTSKIREIIVDL